MKLKEFIKQLKDIAKKRGGDIGVVMADNISVVEPKFSDKYPGPNSCVVITDQS